jgi:3-mercaptopyruvate sulfurtransferase SseA
VALRVISQGFDPQNVYVLKGGLAAWQSAGYAVTSGETP